MKARFFHATFATALVLAATSHAQETGIAPLEEAKAAAFIVTQASTAATALQGAPVVIEADVERPQLIKGEGGAGALVVPHKSLTADVLANAPADKPTPIAQLWLHKATLVREGKATPDDRTRRASVSAGDKTFDLQVYLLAVMKSAEGKLELALFGRDSVPLLKVPMDKSATATTQALPAELSGEKTSPDSATLTVSLLGQYKAGIPLTKRAE